MKGGLTIDGLKKLEKEIESKLAGRNPKSDSLEIELKNRIGEYSYEVEYFNLMNQRESYCNKFGTPTPSKYRADLSLANFMRNGNPTSERMAIYIKSFEAFLEGHPSRKDIANIASQDPLFNENSFM